MRMISFFSISLKREKAIWISVLKSIFYEMLEPRAATCALQWSRWSKTLKTRLQNLPLLQAPFVILGMSGSSVTIPIYETGRITITRFFGVPWNNLIGNGVLASTWLYILNPHGYIFKPGSYAYKRPSLEMLLKTSLVCMCKWSMSLCASLSHAVACLPLVRKIISASRSGKISNDYLNSSQFRKYSEYNCKYHIVTVLMV